MPPVSSAPYELLIQALALRTHALSPHQTSLPLCPTVEASAPSAPLPTQAATPGVTQRQQGDAGAAGLPAAAAAAPSPSPGQQQQQQPAAAAGGQDDGLILTDLVPDALALVYDCLPSKEDRRSLMHSCRAIHSLPQLRAKVGVEGWVCMVGLLRFSVGTA